VAQPQACSLFHKNAGCRQSLRFEEIMETRGLIMCQMSVVVEKDGVEEMLLEDVTTLQVGKETLKVSTLFEGTRELRDMAIRSIDFMAGKVFLQKKNT
jgi:predicted RNA-binding protein